jgi:NAD+ kinase
VSRRPARRLEGPIGRIGVVFRDGSPEVTGVIEHLTQLCEARGVSVTLEDGGHAAAAEGHSTLDLARNPVDLVVALGGDGTLLRAARAAVAHDTPVLGVNLGRLGFLTAMPASDLEAGLARVLEGDAQLDCRSTLCARVISEGEVSGDKFHALNDIVVHTSGAARVTPLLLRVEDGDASVEIGSFAADGVILATPTGSTAYSMSAGGPVIAPDVPCILVTPICPHSLAVRPLVVPSYEELTVRPLDPEASHQLTVDGQIERRLGPGETVVVARGDCPVSLVRLPGQTFFGTLRRKLNWGAVPPERA